MAYIDFHVGDFNRNFDGRIGYLNDLVNPMGLALFAGFTTTPNIWMDISHNVGIGTKTPTEQLDVNGDLEANKIFLKANGINEAELKLDYKGGAYYAVYAP